jgi:hypothetical protein
MFKRVPIANAIKSTTKLGFKAAKKAKSWKAKTIESYALHALTTTDKVIANDRKEVFEESFENN